MSSYNKKIELDPRIKLLLIIIIGTFSFLVGETLILAWNFAVITLLLIFTAQYSLGVKSAFIYGLILYLHSFGASFIRIDAIHRFVSMFFFMIERMMPLLVLTMWMMKDLKIGNLIISLQKVHVPKGFIITISVIFRFFPTIKYEFHKISNTMKLRNIELSAKHFITNPAQTLEYALVPLVLRCMKIADDLTIASMTRGLSLDKDRTSYENVTVTARDIISLIVFTGLSIIGHLI